MSDVAIRVEGLGKRYNIGALQKYKALRDTLTDALYAPFRLASHVWNGRSSSADLEENFIWAIKDISFDVKCGEVIGIIGRNGAGKSTLLKILSRITEPTEGRAELHGRVGSLLEVGTGFHPELTGRENVFLNGAIMGMRKAEINQKFDEIVAFAEVDRFIDTPVKHYSSGMFIRLAFSVAAHMETEILLVDEVLAVGDAAFQKKCLGKMGDVAREGRTVLFVSHNMGVISNLCKRGVVLKEGEVSFVGNIKETMDHYISIVEESSQSTPLRQRKDREGEGNFRFTNISFSTSSRTDTDILISGEKMIASIEYESKTPHMLRNVTIDMPFFDRDGKSLFMCSSKLVGKSFESLPPQGKIYIEIPKFPLCKGSYRINLYCEVNGILSDWVKEAACLDVIEGDYFGTGYNPDHGEFLVEHEFYQGSM